VKATLKPIQTKDQWGEGLNAFRERHKLGWRQFESICQGAISRRSMRRLCKGEAQPRFQRPLRPLLINILREFLRDKGLADSAIEKELRAIFCEEEIKPLITHRAVLTKPAQQFFGVTCDPFTGDPRSRSEVFTTPRLDRIASQLEDAIRYQGFIAVVGDVGAGKSLLKKRVVQTCLDSRGKLEILWPHFFNMEQVHSGSIASFILRKFEQKVPSDRVQRTEKLRLYLASLSEEGIRVALGFDECHRLHPNMLTALKNFWELGSGGYDRYLGLILFGQPRFEMTLRNTDFREIAERLDIVRMPDLSKQDDAWRYILLRVKTAGGSAEKLFDRGAIDTLTRISAMPLALGNLANAALMKAYEFNEHKVTKEILRALLGPDNGSLEGEPRVRAVKHHPTKGSA